MIISHHSGGNMFTTENCSKEICREDFFDGGEWG